MSSLYLVAENEALVFLGLLCYKVDGVFRMSLGKALVHAKWVIGRVIGTKMCKTAKVRVTRLVMDPYLLKYYNKRKTYFAHDALQQCLVGDVVLLKALREPRSKHVKHELAEIVYKVGRVVDPLTGKRVAGTEFVEPLTDLPLNLVEEATLTEKLQELNISAASSGSDSLPAQTPTSS